MNVPLELRLLAFALLTFYFTWISRHALCNPRTHGFWRFFAWKCIEALVLMNLPIWKRRKGQRGKRTTAGGTGRQAANPQL